MNIYEYFTTIKEKHPAYIKNLYSYNEYPLNNNLNNYNASTLEDNNMMDQAFSLQKEMPIQDMKNILMNIKNKYSIYNIHSKTVINEYLKKKKIDSNIFAYHLLFQINEYVLNKKLYSNKHIFTFFNINNIFSIIIKNNYSKIAIKISRKYKIYDFTIEFDIKYRLKNDKIIVDYTHIILKGINNDYKFDNLRKNINNIEYSPIINNNNNINYNLEFNNLKKKINLNDKLYGNDSLYHIQYNENIINYPNHSCFILNKDNEIEELNTQNPIECQSYWNKYNYNGIWDKKCKHNNECPFYKSNKNYPNNYGGCNKKNGICQMPEGIIRIGFKKYLKTSKPLCHGCPLNNQSCCNNQTNPDYKFRGDLTERNKTGL